MDTEGLLLKVKVHSAGIGERAGARLLLEPTKGAFTGLKLLWADAGYDSKSLTAWVGETLGAKLEIVKQKRRWGWYPEDVEPPPYPVGFQVLKRRWVVERTFAWLGRYRRLSKDYEVLCETSEALIYAAMVSLMITRLVKM